MSRRGDREAEEEDRAAGETVDTHRSIEDEASSCRKIRMPYKSSLLPSFERPSPLAARPRLAPSFGPAFEIPPVE